MGRRDAPKIDHPYVFSVSQIETFLTCPRKWAFQKIDRIEVEPNKFAELGDRVHDVLEAYLDRGVPIDRDTTEGRIAFPGLRHLPVPKLPGMRVEKWFAIRFGVAAYRGLKDVELPPTAKMAGGIPMVIDHKSTRNFVWKKSKSDLILDVQSGIYSAHSMQKFRSDKARCKWIYYRTEGAPKSEPVEVVLNKVQVAKTLTFVDETARRMIRVLNTSKRAIDVEADYTGCSAYGGCPFRTEHCKPKPVNVLKSIMAQKNTEKKKASTDDFLADLRSRKNKKSGNKPKKRVEVEEVEEIDTEDQINSKDRDEVEQPGPPPPKKFGDKWVQAEWDEAEWEWKFPEEVEKAEKKAAKKGSGKSGGKKKAALDLFSDNPKKKKKKEEPESEEEEEEEVSTKGESEILPWEAVPFLDKILDRLADKIAAKLAARDDVPF